MQESTLIFSIFLIFFGAAIFSTAALLTRQSLLVAYMVLGVVLGHWGFNSTSDAVFVKGIGDVGIIFLLFLLGLQLPPQKLMRMLQKVSLIGVFSSIAFALIGYFVGMIAGLNNMESIVVGAAMMFSSTIIGIKLLPTTVLHHRHTGELMISVLLLQDIIAIVVLILMHGAKVGGTWSHEFRLLAIGLPVTLIVAFLVERYVVLKLLMRFSRIKEYTFLVAIAWCLTMSELAVYLGLSAEIGGFIAGVTLATSPIAVYIAESLKPIRDFFLVMFFFSVGAAFNLSYLNEIILPAALLALIMLVAKPAIFRLLFGWFGEEKKVSWEVGFRLGQISEFSLIIAYVAMDSHLIRPIAAYLIEATAILTFIFSSYYVVLRYPTPVAMSEKLRRD